MLIDGLLTMLRIWLKYMFFNHLMFMYIAGTLARGCLQPRKWS